MQPRYLPLGDSALTVEFGDRIDRSLVAAVAALDARLNRDLAAGRLPGVIETVPTYRSLTILFDPLVLRRRALQAWVEQVLELTEPAPAAPGRLWRLPVCYGGAFGPDLEGVARACGLSPEGVVELHRGEQYLVYMLGFLPGFAFMGDVPSALRMPRRAEPRTRVPAGSVAIAGAQTAIYPWASPGGWQLLGRCPVPLFDPLTPEPALLAPGDRVEFAAISPARLRELEQEIRVPGFSCGRFLLREARP
jgi:inhibitor of KinA